MIQKETNSLATASMILGIVSLVTSCCCFLGVILGSLAIIFACLSRLEPHFTGHAKAGLIMGIIGIVLSFVLTVLLLSQSSALDIQSNFGNFYY